MPRRSRLQLPPLDLGGESLGQRVARLRKEKGYTQVELARKMGLTQNLISAYECGRLRLPTEMAIRFSQALEASVDELLGFKPGLDRADKTNAGLLRRLSKIRALPPSQQKTLIKTIDTFLKAAGM
ncbi:MAG: helix-turn-helix domain-containing protein [Acidobacteriota bacterium]